MGLTNFKSILRGTSGLDAVKLLLLQSIYSRPRYSKLASALLRPFYRAGKLSVHFDSGGRRFTVDIRKSDQASDFYSLMEIGVRHIYNLDPAFAPTLVIDGGGNIGVFTLCAAALYPGAQIRTCEPVPWNVAQIRTHLAQNDVTTDLLEVCIGGYPRRIPFYCREANQSSFDPGKPYTSTIEVPVVTLAEITKGEAQRILIKLDIEGMEREALESYLPGEHRSVYIVGELHGHKQHHAEMERLFVQHGWRLRFDDVSDAGSIFAAWSPAACDERSTRRSASA
ncbi:MAG TPA: FkbM family methyltransferase [Candidatus Aquilonibacter sp.]|nr:FkbM family methyltransferase [Candidatus Aquilonibacter sp.]